MGSHKYQNGSIHMKKLYEILTVNDIAIPIFLFIILNNTQNNVDSDYELLFNFILSLVSYFSIRLFIFRNNQKSCDNIVSSNGKASYIAIILTNFSMVWMFFILIDTFINKIVYDNIWKMLYQTFFQAIIPAIIIILFEIFLKKLKKSNTEQNSV